MKKTAFDIIISVFIPFLILTYLSEENKLGVNLSLILSATIPTLYGIFEYKREKKINYVSLLGLIGIILTPVIGLMRLNNEWLAVKETLIPLIIGIILIFLKDSKADFVGLILAKVHDRNNFVKKNNSKILQQYKSIYNQAFYSICFSFFLSAMLNYLLVKLMVTSPPGTIEYNQELGRMTFISFIIIGICSSIVIIYSVFKFINKLSKLNR